MKQTKNILIVGVGGQGVLLASELLSAVAVEAGLDAKKSEVHGMAQRGGVVSSHVRIGEKVYSPLIPKGEADVILAFEEAEALRWSFFLKPKGTMVVNQYKLVPPIASMKGFDYPQDPVKSIQTKIDRTVLVDAEQIARELGNIRLVNTILLGVVSRFLDIDEAVWKKVIRERVPKGTETLNIEAFSRGRRIS
ncbi:MAG TPA: indolepyruvate oxidoreductase subunit beta [bacterium]|nr:indolepyruvate oxidoreductase subunit beta [bacterium]